MRADGYQVEELLPLLETAERNFETLAVFRVNPLSLAGHVSDVDIPIAAVSLRSSMSHD